LRLYLINPSNSLVGITKIKENRWNKYRVWKPLNLLVIAGLTPLDWDITVIDENLDIPDYAAMPQPDLVGITAFTSQAPRAYEISRRFRKAGIPVVMGGIHATMRRDEAVMHADAVVTGEAEGIWGQVLEDFKKCALKKVYNGSRLGMDRMPVARHDLLPKGYLFGAIQTTRGCPLNCIFCSVSSFNGRSFRHRPIADVMQEFKMIKEKYILIVDDNLVGTRKDHIARTKELFRAMIKAKLGKRFAAQVTINMADDEELIKLAAKAGCFGVFIGFESTSVEGLAEIQKKFNVQNGRSIKESVKRLKKHGILVVGSFIMGLDVDTHGIGNQTANTASYYGLDILNTMMLTPLPGTRLWEKLEYEERIIAHTFPDDWKYYTLTYPVAKYKNLSHYDMLKEEKICSRLFYSYPRIMKRFFKNLIGMHHPIITLLANIIYRSNVLRSPGYKMAEKL
jgi:radical SAM superfamily enzyme YgiQ (UPF0313 family)